MDLTFQVMTPRPTHEEPTGGGLWVNGPQRFASQEEPGRPWPKALRCTTVDGSG
jgi:hypothetical protein